MVSIGSLVWDVVADTADFQRGVFETRKELNAAKRVFLDTRTPAERLGLEMEGLRRLYEKGAISAEAYRRAVDRLKKQLKQGGDTAAVAGGKFKGFAGQMAIAAAGALSLGRAWASTRDELARIDELAKTSRKLGFATNDMIALRLAASELAGVGDQQLSNALKGMTRRVAEAAAGTGEARKSLDELGLDAVALNAAGPAEAFKILSEAISGVASDSDQLRLTFNLFGRSGSEIVNVLKEGGSAVDEYRAKAEELGLFLSDEMTDDVEAANDAMERAKLVMRDLATDAAVSLAPALEGLADRFVSLKLAATDFFTELIVGLPGGIGVRGDRLDKQLADIRANLDPELLQGDVEGRKRAESGRKASTAVKGLGDTLLGSLTHAADLGADLFGTAKAKGDELVRAAEQVEAADVRARQAEAEKADAEKKKDGKEKPIKVELPPSATKGSREEFQALARLNNQEASQRDKQHAETLKAAHEQLAALGSLASDIATALGGFFPEPIEGEVATFTVTEGRAVSMGLVGTADSLAATWSKEYFVEVSGGAYGDDEVLSAPGLPIVNRSTYYSNGRIIPFIICREKKVTQHNERLSRWTVQCVFKSPPSRSASEANYQAVTPPAALTDITPSEVPIFGQVERVLYEDKAGEVIRTPSGRFWAEAVIEVIPTLTIQMTQYETAPVLYTTLLDRLKKVNDDTYRTQARYKWMIESLEPTAVEVELSGGPTSAVMVTYRIALSPDAAGWKAQRALFDTHYLDGGVFVPFKKDSELGTLTYGRVTISGSKKTGGTLPDYVDYEPQDEIDFGSFLQA